MRHFALDIHPALHRFQTTAHRCAEAPLISPRLGSRPGQQRLMLGATRLTPPLIFTNGQPMVIIIPFVPSSSTRQGEHIQFVHTH